MEAWAIARHDLGLATEEWLAMTPRMIHALRKQRLEQMQREELMIGIIASTTANFSISAPKQPIRAEAFMLHPIQHKIEPKQVTGDDIRAALASFPRVEG